MAATAIGGTLLLLQIAHHKGYIKVRLFIIKVKLRFWRVFSFKTVTVQIQFLPFSFIHFLSQVDWNKMTQDSTSVADKIKKKLHIQSKSGLEKFQVSPPLLIAFSLPFTSLSSQLLFRNGVPKTSTLLVASLEGFSLASPHPDSEDHC